MAVMAYYGIESGSYMKPLDGSNLDNDALLIGVGG